MSWMIIIAWVMLLLKPDTGAWGFFRGFGSQASREVVGGAG